MAFHVWVKELKKERKSNIPAAEKELKKELFLYFEKELVT